MSTVYRAVLEGPFDIQRAVAVKIFDPLASDDEGAVLHTLTQAARDAACIHHPNVVALYELGLASPGQPFAILELVEGRPLSALIDSCARACDGNSHERAGRLPLDVALFIGLEIAEALAGARLSRTPGGVQLGVVHGELSSSDVLLSWAGEVKVTDFGFAVAARASSSVRSVHALARRMRSLAPEVARGGEGDARSDVFSLGITLRELLVGPRFPRGMSDSQALASARDGIVHSSVFEPQLSQELRALLARALEREPGRRFPHAGVFAYELRRIALAMGVSDGRSFLRNAMPALLARRSDDDEVTGEIAPRRCSTSDGDGDRFARLRGERASGMVRKAKPWDFEDEDE